MVTISTLIVRADTIRWLEICFETISTKRNSLHVKLKTQKDADRKDESNRSIKSKIEVEKGDEK